MTSLQVFQQKADMNVGWAGSATQFTLCPEEMPPPTLARHLPPPLLALQRKVLVFVILPPPPSRDF